MERAFRESWAALKRPGLTVSRKEWWRELVFRTLGQENEPCFTELFELFSRAEAWRIFPDVEETLRKARACGRHVSIISNWDERLRPLLKSLRLVPYFDSITISCEAGAEKPDKEIFRTALLGAAVTPGEALHIGDNYEEDVRGAEAVGMRAVLINRRNDKTYNCTCIRDLSSSLRFLN